MEKMESVYRNLFRDVSPSVVLVERVGRLDYFCVGSVILNDDENTYILTQPNVVASSDNLAVRFFDGFTQPATLLEKDEKICILMTKFYHKSKVVQFSEGDINHSYAAAIAPATRSSVYKLPGYIIQKTLVAREGEAHFVGEKDDYFTFTCRYGDKSPNGVSRLSSGPVFNLDAQVLGIVFTDMEYRLWPEKENGERIHDELYFKTGFFFKIAMRSRELVRLLNLMFDRPEGSDWRKGLKQKVQKLKGA